MRYIYVKWIVLAFIFFFLAIGSVFYLKDNRLNNMWIKVIQKPGEIIFSNISVARNFISSISTSKKLIEENIHLQEENSSLLSELAITDDLKKENKFLRDSLGLGLRLANNLQEGGIFGMTFMPTGHEAFLNKGSKDGVVANNVILTSTGALLGTVSNVFNEYSKVQIITSGNFKSTARTIGELSVSGIVSGALSDGLKMEFVSQDEKVAEGDLVITTGNDLFPAGLILGKIDFVTNSDFGVFQRIRVRPLALDSDLSRVIILINKQ